MTNKMGYDEPLPDADPLVRLPVALPDELPVRLPDALPDPLPVDPVTLPDPLLV